MTFPEDIHIMVGERFRAASAWKGPSKYNCPQTGQRPVMGLKFPFCHTTGSMLSHQYKLGMASIRRKVMAGSS